MPTTISQASSAMADFVLRDFTSFSTKERASVAEKVAKLERKVFPAIEHFNYDVELKKKNTSLIVAFRHDDPINVVAYLVYQRIKRLVWLHKLCVVEQERERGLGKHLVLALRAQMEQSGCQSIHLWVDESRKPARALYTACQFQQAEYRAAYYAEGRSGLRLVLELGK
ncbi:hypothetical protein IAQ61_000048 [Plenodomus lingam]|nr:hypothetical protein IAQ61_000048 [Plenodomus lingam]